MCEGTADAEDGVVRGGPREIKAAVEGDGPGDGVGLVHRVKFKRFVPDGAAGPPANEMNWREFCGLHAVEAGPFEACRACFGSEGRACADQAARPIPLKGAAGGGNQVGSGVSLEGEAGGAVGGARTPLFLKERGNLGNADPGPVHVERVDRMTAASLHASRNIDGTAQSARIERGDF